MTLRLTLLCTEQLGVVEALNVGAVSTVSDLYNGLQGGTNRYEMAFVATWREARQQSKNPKLIPFSKEDIVRHGDELRKRKITSESLAVKNIPDIIYTYRARADLPNEILNQGHYAIIGRGKGLYAFAQIDIPNRVRLPSKIKETVIDDAIPAWVAPYMGNDEQGMLTSLSANNLVAKYLNLKRAFRLQSHLRMGIPNYGQVEVDEVYIGEQEDGSKVGILVEAKDRSEHDCLNVSQLFGTAQAARKTFSSITTKLLGVKPDQAGRICVCEFVVSTDVEKLRQARDWHAYRLKASQ